jgi:trimethylamine:corrinoid methyltransferase-like protein
MWEQSGRLTTEQRAHEIVERILAAPLKSYLPLDLVEDLFGEFDVAEHAHDLEEIEA